MIFYVSLTPCPHLTQVFIENKAFSVSINHSSTQEYNYRSLKMDLLADLGQGEDVCDFVI